MDLVSKEKALLLLGQGQDPAGATGRVLSPVTQGRASSTMIYLLLAIYVALQNPPMTAEDDM